MEIAISAAVHVPSWLALCLVGGPLAVTAWASYGRLRVRGSTTRRLTALVVMVVTGVGACGIQSAMADDMGKANAADKGNDYSTALQIYIRLASAGGFPDAWLDEELD